jgi:hypothetical protein
MTESTTIKFSPNYNDLKSHLKFLSVDDFHNIEKRARILSFEDCLIWLGVDLEQIPELELGWAKKAHARGEREGVHEAANHLFANMKTRNGTLAALEYLKAKSVDFNVEHSPLGPAGGGFSFTAVMHDPEKSEPQRPKLVKATG